MFKIIEIIDKYKIKIFLCLVVMYAIGTIVIIKTPEVGVQHIIFISAPTVNYGRVYEIRTRFSRLKASYPNQVDEHPV